MTKRHHINFTFEHDPDLLDDVVLEEKSDGSKDLDEHWLYRETKHIQPQADKDALQIVYLDLDRDEWLDLGIKEALWGQSQVVGGKVICYGSWHEESKYDQSEEFGGPARDISELAIGVLHEGSHGGYNLLNKEDLTHAYFYGYEEKEDDDSQERYAKDADAVTPWQEILEDGQPVNLFVIKTKELTENFKQEVKDVGNVINHDVPKKKDVSKSVKQVRDNLDITQRHLEPISKYSWSDVSQDSVVLHTLFGSIDGSYEHLKNIQLSYNYLIAEDGEIFEMIPPNRCSWHAGVKNEPNDRAREFFGGDNPNRRSLGIGFERNGEASLTKPQSRQCANLIKELRETAGYSLDTLFAHPEITSYKPEEVKNYKRQVEEALSGNKGKKKEEKEKIKLSDSLQSLYVALNSLLNSLRS